MTDQIKIQDKVDDVTNAVAAITATETGISELHDKYNKVVFNCEKSKEMTAAKAARREIREPRYNIETLRKAAKAPVLQLGRSLDAIAKNLTDKLLLIEIPIDAQIKVEEQRIEDEKQAKINAENERIQHIKDNIAKFTDGIDAVINSNRTAENITKCIDAYKKKCPDDSYQELETDALDVWQSGLDRIQKHLDATIDRETEAQRIKAETKEQQRIADENAAQQKLMDEQQRKIDDEKASLDVARKAAAHEEQAKQKRKDADRQAELDKQAKAQKKKAAELIVEQNKVDAENARIAQESTIRKATQEAEEKANKERREAARIAAEKAIYPGDETIIIAISEYLGVPKDIAKKWLKHTRK